MNIINITLCFNNQESSDDNVRAQTGNYYLQPQSTGLKQTGTNVIIIKEKREWINIKNVTDTQRHCKKL